MKRYKKSTMNTQEREIFRIPAAWVLSCAVQLAKGQISFLVNGPIPGSRKMADLRVGV
jgi:hypothetical protein